ncbi:MAG: hypothetical protein IT328_23745 [Caldilineaceae bacterium]|nr:hypothetical protein [Caldilineaceae bacterium]
MSQLWFATRYTSSMPLEYDRPIMQPENELMPRVVSEQLPPEVLAYPQWVCWRYVARGQGKKPDKQPVNPRTLGNAGVHWPNTWCTFEQALSTYTLYRERGVAGLGFVLTRDDPFVGIDADNCVADDEIAAEAQEVICHLASYTEISPSLHGLRILVTCPEYKKNVRTTSLEVYSHSRFLTLTGQHLVGTPTTITPLRHDDIEALFRPPVSAKEDKRASHSNHITPANEPMSLWERIFAHDQYGAQHLRRFQGDTTLDHGDHSLTVIRLLNCLARWTDGDALRMREMMLMSPLKNEKWLSKRGADDWLERQIVDAIAFVQKGKSRRSS